MQDALCWLVVNSNWDFESLTNFQGDVTPLATSSITAAGVVLNGDSYQLRQAKAVVRPKG